MATQSSTPECNRPAKRQKLSPHAYFEDTSKEVRWPDIKRILTRVEGDDAEPGWIAGQVFMIFASRQRSEAQIRSSDNLQLKISISCPEYDLFKFSFGQSIKVSLRGACVSLLKGGTSAIGFMPFHLVFKDGAAIKFLNEKNDKEDGNVVDSWQVRSNQVQQSEHWYMSSPIREESIDLSGTNSRSGSVSAATFSSSPSILDTPGKTEESFPLVSSATISNEGAGEDEDLSMRSTYVSAQDEFISKGKASLPESSPRVTSVPLTEHKDRKPKKRDTRHENRPRDTSVESDTDSRNSGPQQKSKLSRAERKTIKRKRRQVARQRSPSPPKRNPALDLVAGISSETGAYPPLEAIRENQIVHVIGVVVYTEEPMVTQKGDFKITITLADPSKYENGLGFKITCFTDPHNKHLLPSVPKGHVLLLRDVKASAWIGRINGIVYTFKLKWSAYNPDTGKVYYPDGPSSSSPGSFGSVFDACYQPRESEIQYCAQLGEWWRAKKEEAEHGVIQIADFSNGPSRKHCLIGTCDVEVFFDATVELLRLEEADSGQIMLFFTDYTPHPLRSVEGYYGQWGMHASTSRIDPTILDIMKPGQYWTIKNMRLKNGSMNFLEADLYDARFYEVIDEEDDIHLSDLLIRKETYLKDHPHEAGGSGRSDITESSLSDISEPGHVNLVAELLYRVNVKETMIDLYVTDYTENPSLSSFEPKGLKRQLDGMPVSTLQISAWDGHELVRTMEIGSIYTFTDVRIVRQHDGSVKGNLKLADKRITRMNVKKTDNPAVLALLERKKECSEKQLARLASGSLEGEKSVSPVESQRERRVGITISNAIRSRHTDQPKNTIKEVKSIRKCPNKFRLIARIVDFFPLDISDFTVRICTNCNQRIPDKHNACLMCEDMMGEYVKWIFRFFFQLEDEEGERIIVDAYSEAKHFLLNITPCDLRECHEVLSAVKRRLRDCLGNLVEVHEGLSRQELVEAQYGPFFDLAIKSWEIEDGNEQRRVYALTGCEAVELPKRKGN